MGPTAGLLFGDLGADVVKVEPAPAGDHTRGLGGFGAGFFAAFNRNKRSLALDLKRPAGQAVMHCLAATVDVVIENFGPGTTERLGRLTVEAPGRSSFRRSSGAACSRS